MGNRGMARRTRTVRTWCRADRPATRTVDDDPGNPYAVLGSNDRERSGAIVRRLHVYCRVAPLEPDPESSDAGVRERIRRPVGQPVLDGVPVRQVLDDADPTEPDGGDRDGYRDRWYPPPAARAGHRCVRRGRGLRTGSAVRTASGRSLG